MLVSDRAYTEGGAEKGNRRALEGRGGKLTLGTNAHLVLGVVLQETLNTTARELWTIAVSLLLLEARKVDKAVIAERCRRQHRMDG